MKNAFRAAVVGCTIALVVVGCSKKPGTDYEDVDTVTSVAYTVQPGDSWAGVSEDFFGTPEMAPRIAQDNGFTPGDPIPVGSSVNIQIHPDELDVVRRLADARDPYNTGVALLNEERYEEAVAAFEEALDRAPEFVDARYNLGLAYLKLGRPAESIEALKPVVEIRADDKDAHYALASAYFFGSDYESALPELVAALALDPDFLRARFTYALALERVGESVRSREAWEAYLQLDSSSAWAKEAREHLEALP